MAEVVVAEIAPDRGAFPSARHLASWAALCPGHHEGATFTRPGLDVDRAAGQERRGGDAAHSLGDALAVLRAVQRPRRLRARPSARLADDGGLDGGSIRRGRPPLSKGLTPLAREGIHLS